MLTLHPALCHRLGHSSVLLDAEWPGWVSAHPPRAEAATQHQPLGRAGGGSSFYCLSRKQHCCVPEVPLSWRAVEEAVIFLQDRKQCRTARSLTDRLWPGVNNGRERDLHPKLLKIHPAPHPKYLSVSQYINILQALLWQQQCLGLLLLLISTVWATRREWKGP